MDAELRTNSRMQPRWWVLLLVVMGFVTSEMAACAGPLQARRPEMVTPLQCWVRIMGSRGPVTADAVLLCVDLADPGTLQVPTHALAPATIMVKPVARTPKFQPERMTQMLGTAGCLMLPGWKLRLTTLSLIAN